MKDYKHLSLYDRETLSNSLARGWKLTDIAKVMGYDKSTISREIKRTHLGRAGYRALTAQALSNRRKLIKRKRCKISANLILQEYIHAHLRMYWSPEEIANRLKLEYPSDPTMRISHETIYTYLYVRTRGNLRKEFLSYLREKRRLRGKRGNLHPKRGQIPNMVTIDQRPEEVDQRVIPGHWEGDLMMGKGKFSALGTLVERTTRTTILVPLKIKTAKEVRKAFERETKDLPSQMKLSLTYDRGREMSEHELFTKDTKIKVYFADPYSPWQRGTNENTNGLIRQFFPKGVDFSKIKRKEIKAVQDLLNGRPRKVLGWLTPFEVFDSLLH